MEKQRKKIEFKFGYINHYDWNLCNFRVLEQFKR